jgi:hypothetical protein
MYPIDTDLVREHSRNLLSEADRERRAEPARQLRRMERLQRRADRACRRAMLALARSSG